MKKAVIDKFLEVLVGTENELPCDELLDLPKEEKKCSRICRFDSPRKQCWIRWAKIKAKWEAKHGRGRTNRGVTKPASSDDQ